MTGSAGNYTYTITKIFRKIVEKERAPLRTFPTIYEAEFLSKLGLHPISVSKTPLRTKLFLLVTTRALRPCSFSTGPDPFRIFVNLLATNSIYV